MGPLRTLVVLPCFNEAASAPAIIPRIRAAGADVLVVDDASPDGTADIVEEAFAGDGGVRVLRHPPPRSFAHSALDGLRAAIAGDYDAVATMDADGSHDPASLPTLIAGLASADLVVGSRYVEGGKVVNWPVGRIAMSVFANTLARGLLRLPVRDLTSGFMAMKVDVPLNLRLCAIKTQGYGYLMEFKWRAVRAGFAVAEEPIAFTERQEGVSKMSAQHAREALGMLLRLGWMERTRGPDADCED